MTEQNSSQLLDNLCSFNNYCISRDNRRELLDSIVTSALGLLDCDSVALILSDEQKNNSLCYVSCSGNGTENYMGMVLNRSEGIQGSVLREGQSVLINNLSQASIFPAGSNNSNAYLAIPLKLHNKTYGLIEAHGHSFSSKQIPLLELMANQVILILLICDSGEQDSNQPDSMDSSQEIKGLVGQEKIITVSSIVQSLLDKVKKIASSESPVLISGESGTGKELFASNIHLNSLRSDKSIVRVNCAALSRGIFESELFGHVEGAFTDARQNKIGFFEQANGGTLFLDEISELTPNIQSSLLRVLNDGCYYPVGAEFSKKVDIRLIVATNRNLLECVRKGTFREDLYYRLAVFFVEIPPLRKRPDDIEVLAEHFIREFSEQNNRKILSLSTKSLQSLLLHSWPGNVRELRNVIQRSIILKTDNSTEITPEDLSINLSSTAFEQTYDLRASISSFKKKLIIEVLKAHNGNRTATSKALGIQRTYLSRIIRELNIGGNI